MAVSADALEAMKDAKRRVPAVIRQLMSYRGVKTYQIAQAIGVAPSAVSARLGGGTVIKQEEMEAIAVILGVPVAVLYLTPDAALRWVLDHPSEQAFPGNGYIPELAGAA